MARTPEQMRAELAGLEKPQEKPPETTITDESGFDFDFIDIPEATGEDMSGGVDPEAKAAEERLKRLSGGVDSAELTPGSGQDRLTRSERDANIRL